jgi:hypothetical protein
MKKQLSEEAQAQLAESMLANSSKYPFNQMANVFSVLLTEGGLNYESYTNIRNEYFKRNPYLDLFEKAPRTFGQTWGEAWLREKNELLQEPYRREGYNPQYDLWLPNGDGTGIKIEVKSSRVVKSDPELLLVEKAYKRPVGTEKDIKQQIEQKLSFKMNFQQLKPECCNIFIWIAVWLDDIDIWAIPSEKIIMRPKNAKRRSPKDSIVNKDGSIYMGVQHAGGEGGNIPEGQIYVTNKHFYDLECYKVTLDNLIETIKNHGNPN